VAVYVLIVAVYLAQDLTDVLIYRLFDLERAT
jgi:hypothetical protein